MKLGTNLFRSFCISLLLVVAGLLSSQVHADGIASVNQFVEIKPNADDFRARKQSNSGQRSTSGFDFIITPERTDICQQGQTSSICSNTYFFSGLGYVPNGSATSIVFSNTPANSYLVFINDDHDNGTDRESMIGEIVFDNEILGYWTDPSRTVDFDYVDKPGALYPNSNNNGFSARQTENHRHYGSSTTSSTTQGDWVSIGADKRTLRFGAKNGRPGDYIRVITRASNPIIDFDLTSSEGAESVSSAALTVDLSFPSTQNVTVNYSVTGTATGSGTDYTLANGILTINAGLTSGTINITGIVNDSLDEPNETVIVTLSNPSNATLGTNNVHTYTINDNDNAPVVEFNNTSSNDAESVSSKAITVDLSAASSQDVTVNYVVTGTATGSGTDYTLTDGTATIPANATSTTITIGNIVDDSLDELNETVIVTLSNPNNATLGSKTIHTYTITDDDDAPVVSFNSPSSNGAESVSSKAITVDLSSASGKNVTVNYAVTGSATGSGTDYTLENGTLTFSAGATFGIISIGNIVDDLIYEADETVIITLSSPNNATLGAVNVHTFTINDNDNAPVVDFSSISSNDNESVSSKAITVELSAASTQSVTVDYTLTGTASGSGTDYTLADGTLTISAGLTSGMITIAGIVDDGLDEPNETVIVTLSNPSNATLGDDSVHTYFIIDNDDAPVVDFSSISSNDAESVSSKALTVDLSAASSQDVTVNYVVTGTATGSGTDYTLADGVLTISASETSGIITIGNIIDDGLDEPNETVVVTLSNPSNATLGNDSVHTYTIFDNDDAPVVEFNTPASSDLESVSSKAITVDLSAVSGQNVTVDYAVTGTATGSGTDYTLANGTLTINASSTSDTITIGNIVDDGLDEPNETVIITLSSPNNATLGDNSVHTYTITDDDDAPVVEFNTPTSSNLESVSSKAITVDLSAASSQNVTVDYVVTGTATGSGTDYTLANGTLTINAATTSGTITIGSIVDDSLDEPHETVIVTLSNPSNATLGNNNVHTYTITDNDDAPLIAFEATSSSGAETEPTKDVIVNLSAVSEQIVTINYAVTGTATGSGEDYTLENGVLTIDAGETSGTITIAGIVDDGSGEGNETVILTLSNPNNATLGSNDVHTFTILEPLIGEGPSRDISFVEPNSSGAESESSTDLTVQMSASFTADATINYAVTGTATGSGTDYTLANGTATIAAGSTSTTITIAGIIDDSLDEVNETVIVTLSNPTNANQGSILVHTYTIIDNDNEPEVSFGDTSSSGAESVSSAGLTVDLSAASGKDVTINYVVTGTATGSGTDYTLANGTLTISAGETSGTINISSIIDDLIDEADETVIVTLSNPTNAVLGTENVHTYIINDNDSAPVIDFNAISSSRTESVSSTDLTVDLSAVSGQDITVDYVVTGTATGSGTDYTLANGTLTIDAGATSGTITIDGIIDDLIDEANETVVVTLSNPSNATLGADNVHTYTITDNDNAPVVGFSIPSSSGAESTSSAAITVDLSAASGQNVTVDFAVSGTATGSGTDYTLANGTLTIGAGVTSETITISGIFDDAADEADETVIITLSNPSNATLGGNSVHTYTITDNDDAPEVGFNANSSSETESVSSAGLTVDLSAASSQNVTVDYTVTGTATGSGTDYTLADGSLTISAGATSGLITIAGIVDDSLDEPNETVVVTLSNPSNATLGSNIVHTYTITDNEDAPTIDFNSDSSSGAESVSSKDITVNLSGPSSETIIVEYIIMGTASGSGTDYTLASGTLTIDPGETSGIISIAGIIDDALDEADETIIVTLSNPTNTTLGSNSVHTYTIIDDDDAPVVEFNTTSSDDAESVSSKEITVDLSAVSGQDVTVDYVVSGTATGSGTDYTLADGTLTISAGLTSGMITIAGIVDDGLDEPNETVIVTLSNPSNATLGSNSVHTYTITDNEDTPTIDFNSVSSTGAESESSKDITVNLSGPSSETITVDYAVTGTASGSGDDYTLVNGTLIIDAGSTSGTITIANIIDDSTDETDETVIVTLSSPSNATLGSNDVHTYTIIDDDGMPTVEFNANSSTAAEDISSIALTVDLSAASSNNISVNYSVTGTATGGGTDYMLANGVLTINAGATSGTITIDNIVDDLIDEDDETVIITLSGPSNAVLGNNSVHTYTIRDNDGIPTIEFSSSTSADLESVASRSVDVVIPFASLAQIEVDYEVTGGTAGAGSDYTMTSGSVVIPDGATSGTIVIPTIVDDLADEGDETIIISLSNPVNATLGVNTVHTLVINDNDAKPLLIATSPQDDSTRVPIDSDIILTFNEVVNCESGTINILSDDNSSSFAVSLPSGIVTGCGTETITVNLPTDLEHGTDYYVLIENTVFEDIHGNSFDGINDPTEFNFKTSIELTDPTLKQPVIDNARAMNQIATRWVDQNINVISKRMMTSSRQGLRVNFNNKIIDSIKTIRTSEPANNIVEEQDKSKVEEPLENNFDEEPILEFCTINSSGPKTDPSLKIKVHLSKIALEDVIVDFRITGSSDEENFSFGEGILNIEAGLKSAFIIFDGIPQDVFGFTPGDRKIFVTLLESSNAQLGNNLVYTHTLTDDLKDWTDPNANYFCISDFDNPKSRSLVEANPEIKTSKLNSDFESNAFQDPEQLKSTVQDLLSDPVKITADGELSEIIGDWSIWIDGEFGELTLGKNNPNPNVLDERSFHIGLDKSLSDDGDLFGFALGLGKTKPKDRNRESHVESKNYSLSTYGRFDNKSNALQFILGITKLEFNSDRLDGEELLKGQREANQLFGSLAFIRSLINENSNWLVSPYLRIDGSYTRFDKYSETGGETALTFDELTLSNAKASIGADISYLFEESKYNAMPYITLEYGLDYSRTSSQNMYYSIEGPSINYILDLDDGMKAHNWEVDIGLMLQISTGLSTNIGCRWQGRSNYLSDFSSISKNDLSSSEVCSLDLLWNF